MLADPRSERLSRTSPASGFRCATSRGSRSIRVRCCFATSTRTRRSFRKSKTSAATVPASSRTVSKTRPRRTTHKQDESCRWKDDPARKTNAKQPARQQQRQQGQRRRFPGPRVEFDRDLRVAMRRETEMLFSHVLRENKSVLDLIDSDYTFLNERLAQHYGITDVTGRDMRRVELPPDSPRGGVLTHGSVLAVTSNPTRTSPVKRGLFILETSSARPRPRRPRRCRTWRTRRKSSRTASLRSARYWRCTARRPLCSSCHTRMDPLGLAFENFNAMGMWREKEQGQAVDTTGKLITGEPFQNARDLKRLIRDNRRSDFYRCLTEKLLTYALGRGLEDYDVETVDRIVERLEKQDGRMSSC